MKRKDSGTVLLLVMIALLPGSSACSLLTIERIVDTSPLNPTPSDIEATLAILEGQLDEQAGSLGSVATQLSSLSTQLARQGTVISHLATRGPAASTLPETPSPTPPPRVLGSVTVEDGKCCLGAPAGDLIEIQVQFAAIGLEAPVLAMRTSTGSYANLDQAFDGANWEPFTEQKLFTYRVPINWTGFYVRAQFQDALGNLSPIYMDDISVEGMPVVTPSPGG